MLKGFERREKGIEGREARREAETSELEVAARRKTMHIRETAAVQTSILCASRVERMKKASANVVLLATEPHSDDGKRKLCQK